MKTIISFTCLCIMACNTAFAQNKIKAERIDFEYDASGSLVREVPYEETEER